MKKESFVQDLMDFLQIGQKEMAEFFNISREFYLIDLPCAPGSFPSTSTNAAWICST